MDRGEGQQWNAAPGNLYSTPRKVTIDPSAGTVLSISLDKEIPPIPRPADTKYIKHIRIKSEKLSKFWGRDMHLGANILLPEGFDTHPNARYPLVINHGHFPYTFEGFRETPPDPDLKPDFSARFNLAGYNRIQQELAHQFYKDWTSPTYPRMLIIEIQHPTPYYDDSYAVNTPNQGPYGDAINEELIPSIEKTFRGLGTPWSRFMYGGSTGGWEALAVQVMYPGYRFPDYPLPPGETNDSFLRAITEAGAHNRYRPYHDKARAQIDKELTVIAKLGLAGYFLIVWDLMQFCKAEGILAQGRGSAANSAVCYSLGITAVDPVGMELLFERFLSEERGEWPDIDIDLPSGDRRERVIQHVYKKYGPHGAAMTANVITYREKSAAREIGKVLELPDEVVENVSRQMRRFEWHDTKDTFDARLERAGVDRSDLRLKVFARLFHDIQDLPRHLGQHSGGMIVAQGRLDEVAPLQPASMPGRTIVQWDKESVSETSAVCQSRPTTAGGCGAPGGHFSRP